MFPNQFEVSQSRQNININHFWISAIYHHQHYWWQWIIIEKIVILLILTWDYFNKFTQNIVHSLKLY